MHALGVACLGGVFRVAQHAVGHALQQKRKDRVDLRHTGEHGLRRVEQVFGKRLQHGMLQRVQCVLRQAVGEQAAAEADIADLRIEAAAEAMRQLQRQDPRGRAHGPDLMARTRVKEQNAAGTGGEALPVGTDAAGTAQDVAQFHLLVQVHGAVDHVDDEHRAVGQFGVRDQLIFVVQFHIFTKSHHCRDVEADLSVISLPLSLIITVSEQKNKAELPDGPEFQPRFCKNTGRKYEKRNLLRG